MPNLPIYIFDLGGASNDYWQSKFSGFWIIDSGLGAYLRVGFFCVNRQKKGNKLLLLEKYFRIFLYI